MYQNIPRIVIGEKRSLEFYWWKNDPLNVISEKKLTRMLLVTVQKNLMTLFGEVTGYDFFLVGQNIQKIVISEKNDP